MFKSRSALTGLFILAGTVAFSGSASADVVLTLNGPVAGHVLGPQSTSAPCVICATTAQNPSTFSYNNFVESGSISSYNMFSTSAGSGNNGTPVADGVQGTPYTVSQIEAIVGTAFNIAIDVNTTGAASEIYDHSKCLTQRWARHWPTTPGQPTSATSTTTATASVTTLLTPSI